MNDLDIKAPFPARNHLPPQMIECTTCDIIGSLPASLTPFLRLNSPNFFTPPFPIHLQDDYAHWFLGGIHGQICAA